MAVIMPPFEGDAERRSPLGLEPGRLWSLWDMLTFSAAAFYQVIGDLQKLRGSLSNEHIIRRVEDSSVEEKAYDRDALLCQLVLPQLTMLRSHLADLGARITVIAVDELAAYTDVTRGAYYNYEGVIAGLDDIDTQLRRELSTIKMLVLNGQEQERFNPPQPPFGNEVATKFLSISYDVDEASKCLALGRSTAAVFHTLRSLEAGIRALARCLGIPDPTKGNDRSWGSVLRTITPEIDRRWPKNTPTRLTDECRFFKDAYAALSGMMNPWRNDTMHLDRKYTEEEAKHIFEVVNGFMKKVASRMDENGEPKV